MKSFGKLGKFTVLALVMGTVSSVYAFANWPVNGNLICSATGDQKYPEIVSDGAGGAIIAWQDSRSGYSDIYAQRVDSLGVLKWDADGILICTALNEQLGPRLVSDGAGGAIITWYDGRNLNYDIYAQRVDFLGVLKWDADGIPICTTADYRESPRIVSDRAGGAIITWSDYRGGFANIYAQCIDTSGVVKWITDGVAICATAGDQRLPELVSDGTGGAIMAWQDDRGGYFSIYAQRVDSLGVEQWNPDGVAICTAMNGQWSPELVSDGAGGAIMAWQDDRGGYLNIYAQRVDSSGVVKWSLDGVAIRTATAHQKFHKVVADGAGGAIIAWQDSLDGNWDICTQRVDSSGVVGWAANGVAVCAAPDSQQYPKLVCDGAGGAIVAWQDYRNGNYDIYARRVGADGITDVVFAFASATAEHGRVTLSWRVTVDVPGSSFLIKRSQSPDRDFLTLHVPIDKGARSLFSCIDYSALPGNTYWYKIVLVGSAGEESYGPIEVHVAAVPTAYMAYQSYPNPFNPMCTIRYELPEAGRTSLQVFDLSGSVVRRLADGWREPGVYSEVWDGRSDDGGELPSGVYFYSLKAGEFVTAHKLVLLR